MRDQRAAPDRDRLAAEYAVWMSFLNTRADLTLRCRAMIPLLDREGRVSLALNDDLLRATVVRALNRLNGYALGVRRSGPQPRLDAMVWSERGTASGRPHVHALLERPAFVSQSRFAAMVERAWQAQPFGYHQVRVEEVRDRRASMNYNSKVSPAVSGNVVYFHKERQTSAWWR